MIGYLTFYELFDICLTIHETHNPECHFLPVPHVLTNESAQNL